MDVAFVTADNFVVAVVLKNGELHVSNILALQPATITWTRVASPCLLRATFVHGTRLVGIGLRHIFSVDVYNTTATVNVQKTVVDVQKTVVDVEKTVVDVQKSVVDVQKTVVNVHDTIDDTVEVYVPFSALFALDLSDIVSEESTEAECRQHLHELTFCITPTALVLANAGKVKIINLTASEQHLLFAC